MMNKTGIAIARIAFILLASGIFITFAAKAQLVELKPQPAVSETETHLAEFTREHLNTGNVAIVTIHAAMTGNASQSVWSRMDGSAPFSIPGNNIEADFVINKGVQLTDDLAELNCRNLLIEEGAGINLGSSVINVSGDIINYGSINAQNGTLRLTGKKLQTIQGKALEVYNLVCENPGGVLLNAELLKVNGCLEVNSGIFNTGGKLVLTAGENHNGSIGPLISGDIVGSVTTEFYHKSVGPGWVNICSPVQNKVVADWNDDMITTGFEGADYPNYPFANIQHYEEKEEGSQNIGFTAVKSANEMLAARKGYYTYLNSGINRFDVSGSIYKGDQSIPVSYTNTGNPGSDGWNLVANPYPSAINWDHEQGWNKIGICGALYLWDENKGQYAAYVNGIGNNGGSPVIPSGRSFWVVADKKQPILGINESAKIPNSNLIAESEKQVFTLKMSNGVYRDETTIAFDAGSTVSFDRNLDAYKMAGLEEGPYMATVTPERIDLAINSLPRTNGEFVLPVKVSVPQAGIYTFTHEGLNEFAFGSCVTLEDLSTGLFWVLSETQQFQVQLNPEDIQPRFILRVSKPVVKQLENVSCYGMEDGLAEITGSGTGPWNIIWTNEHKVRFRQVENVYETDIQQNLRAGVYTITIENNGACLQTECTFEITEPDPMDAFVITRPESCPQYNDGRIELVVAGGYEPYTARWNNGAEGFAMNDLPAGSYTAFVKDGRGCTTAIDVEVASASGFTAGFETIADNYDLHNGAAVVDFFNLSDNAESYEWTFGDGTIKSFEKNPTHLYNKPGEYDVTLLSKNNNCESRAIKTITVNQPKTDAVGWSNEVAVSVTDRGIEIFLMFDEQRELIINAYNVLGQQIMKPIRGTYSAQSMIISDSKYATYAMIELVDLTTGEKTLIRVGR